MIMTNINGCTRDEKSEVIKAIGVCEDVLYLDDAEGVLGEEAHDATSVGNGCGDLQVPINQP